MTFISTFLKSQLVATVCLCMTCWNAQAQSKPTTETTFPNEATIAQLGDTLNVGDVVFIQVTPLPFREVSAVTQSWTNHVGIVVDVSGSEPIIAESTFPFSRTTTLSRFLARSEKGRVAVSRLSTPLTDAQKKDIWFASKKRLGIFYDTGFNLHSSREFCSRYVREVLAEATGVTIGEVVTFKQLLTSNPETKLTFWRIWYFGNIPWQRKTVSPASLLQSNLMHIVFDGFASQ